MCYICVAVLFVCAIAVFCDACLSLLLRVVVVEYVLCALCLLL